MANEDIVLSARLEHRQVLAALEDIGRASVAAAGSGDATLKKLAGDAINVAAIYESMTESLYGVIESLVRTGDVGGETWDEQIAQVGELRQRVFSLRKLMDQEVSNLAKEPVPALSPTEQLRLQNIATPGGGGISLGLGAPTKLDIEQFMETGKTEAALMRISDLIDELFGRGEVRAKQFAGVMHTAVMNLKGQLKGDELENALKPIEQDAKNILNLFKSSDFDIAEEANTETLLSQMTELKAVASEFLQGSTEESREFGATLLARLDQVEDKWLASGKNVGVLRKNLNAVNGEFKQTLKTSTDLREEFGAIGKLPIDLQKKLKAKEVETELKRVDNVLKLLGQSGSEEAKETGKVFQELRDKIEESFKAEEMGADEAIKALKEVQSAGNRTGDAFDSNFRKIDSTSRSATASIWKLGTAADRVGARGVSALLRVYDAVKMLGPEFLIAGAAAAGFLYVLTKLGSMAVELARKFADMFKDFVKDSIEASKQIEHIDAQFAGLLGGDNDLGRTLRNYLLEQSLEFGVDLTGDFANILVPLTKNTDQIRQLAKDMAAISHLRGIEMNNLVNSVKQATGGHFRSFQQTLGFTPQEIETVKEMQKEYGELAGTIMGLEQFMDRRGISFEALGDSLSVAQGKLNAFLQQLKIAVGEPVRDTLGEEFHDLIDIVETNRSTILRFAGNVGQAIGDIISKIGDLAGKWADSIDQEDINDIEEAIDGVSRSIGDLIDTIGDFSDENIDTFKDAIIELTEIVSTLVDELRDFVEIYSILSDISDFTIETDLIDLPSVGDLIKAQATKKPGAQFNLPGLFANQFLWGFGGEGIANRIVDDFQNSWLPEQDELYRALEEKYDGSEFQHQILSALLADRGIARNVAERIAERLGIDVDELREYARQLGQDTGTALQAGFDESRFIGWQPNETDAEALKEISRQLELTDTQNQIKDVEEALEDLYDTVGENDLEFKLDEKTAKLLVDLADKEIDIEIDFSIKRRDTTLKYLDSLNEAKIKARNDELEAMEDFDEKEIDIYRKYADKEEDLVEESAKKKIKIEEKYQERLRDIRAKFDFDAAEAIRQNDAVALLRIRRREKFELAQAKEKYQDDIEAADQAAEEKRNDNKKWLERQIRDNNIAERRKLDDLKDALQERLKQLDRNYKHQLELLALHEEDKLNELAEWKRRQERDLDTWYQNELDRLAMHYKDEYQMIAANEQRLRELRIREMELTARAVAPYYNQHMIALPNDPSLPNPYVQPFTYSVTPGGGVYGGYTAQPGSGGYQSPVQAEPEEEADTGPGMDVLTARAVALELAQRGGFDSLIANIPNMLSLQQLNATIAWLRQQGLQHGGIAPAHRPSLVGEAGPESISPVSAGIVAPHVPFIVQPGGPLGGGGIVNDNSSSVSADISMLDPSQLSPMQLTLIRSIIADELLEYGAT